VTKPFDAALNALIDAHVADWAAFLAARAGVPAGPATPLDTDLSATLQADRLFRVDGPVPFALHLELESTGRLGVPDELLRYNVAARAAVRLPVHSVLLVLRPKANATDQTGTLDVAGAGGRPYLTFRYAVVRVWQESVAALLAAGPGLAPLALLTNEADADLPTAFVRTQDRLRPPHVPGKVAEDLLGSARILCGLRYDPGRVAEMYRRLAMIRWEDSTTYMEVLEKGIAVGETRARGAEVRASILRLGGKRFGSPPADAAARLQAVTDLARLEALLDRVLDATGWDDLLAGL
jgi:hypothetical protein